MSHFHARPLGRYVLVVSLFAALAAGAAEPRASGDLTEMSLEELMNVEVTSVSRRAEKLSAAPAAIHVLTDEDIRRSGAMSIPDALRMVPGMNVAQIDSSTWAVSARGFNGRFANKLLVLIDGRTVYTPLFSGVFWDAQDVVLEDIERIEVIRGPGAALWGANAVNGVINIITKHSRDSQGGSLSVAGGKEDRGYGRIRYGGRLGENVWYRVYAKFHEHDHTLNAAGNNAGDAWYKSQGGFRIDWEPNDINALTFQGDLYYGDNRTEANSGRFEFAGGNVLGRWLHDFSDSSHSSLQLYYDRTERELGTALTVFRNSFDIDWQHDFSWGDRQTIVWGAGYRFAADEIFGSPALSFVPPQSSDHLRSVFAQDEISIVPDKLSFTVGAKLEHNDYSGSEFQPNARLQWTPHEKHTIWAAVARAVRSPSRAEHTIRATRPAGPGVINSVSGVSTFDSETLVAYELGWRFQPRPSLSFDVAAFFNDYDDLRSFDVGTPTPPPPALIIPLTTSNSMEGETYGGEVSASWQATKSLRVMAGYSLLQMHLRGGLNSGDSTLEAAAVDNPQQQFHLRSYWDLPANLQLDGALYYVDSLPGQSVPSYVRLDVRLGWRPRENLDFTVGLQNLLDERHPEYGANFLVTSTEVERNFYAKVTWRF
ncbi:MAG: TonB-dependent receptor [Verrucomicrobiota bacterium]